MLMVHTTWSRLSQRCWLDDVYVCAQL